LEKNSCIISDKSPKLVKSIEEKIKSPKKKSNVSTKLTKENNIATKSTKYMIIPIVWS